MNDYSLMGFCCCCLPYGCTVCLCTFAGHTDCVSGRAGAGIHDHLSGPHIREESCPCWSSHKLSQVQEGHKRQLCLCPSVDEMQEALPLHNISSPPSYKLPVAVSHKLRGAGSA